MFIKIIICCYFSPPKHIVLVLIRIDRSVGTTKYIYSTVTFLLKLHFLERRCLIDQIKLLYVPVPGVLSPQIFVPFFLSYL